MQLRENIVQNITTNLFSLTYEKQLAFIYLSCARVLPNYEYFSSEHKFGKPEIFRNALALIEEVFISGRVNDKTVELFISQINAISPSPEKFETILASSAMDCCGCFIETLKFVVDRKIHRILDVLNLSLDTIDMFLVVILNLDQHDEDLEKIIYRHPLMLRELGIQEGIVQHLNQVFDLKNQDLEILRQFQQVNGRQIGSLDVNTFL